MKKFELLTKYLILLDKQIYGNWVTISKNNDANDDLNKAPYVAYCDAVNQFEKDVYSFESNINKADIDINFYLNVLKENNIESTADAMKSADISKLDGNCIIAMLVVAFFVERLCDGALLDFFTDGHIKKWLERLQEIDA